MINRTDRIGQEKEYILEYEYQYHEDRWDYTRSSRNTGLNWAKKTDIISQDQQDIRNFERIKGADITPDQQDRRD
jgi:outer membrane protein assembly factor BamE (lipoprotein component of BamABCDE complex)